MLTNTYYCQANVNDDLNLLQPKSLGHLKSLAKFIHPKLSKTSSNSFIEYKN